MKKRSIEDDVVLIANRVARLQSEAKAYVASPDSSYRFEELCRASALMTEAVRNLLNRKQKK